MRARLAHILRHPIAGNAMALQAAQVAVMLVPLLTLPFLARVLGAAQLGVVVFVQSFSFLLTLLVDYGFAFSGSRDVARLRHDRAALRDTVAAVLGAKLLLTGVCAVAALVAWRAVPMFRTSPELVGMALLLALLQGLHPAWYLGGLERIRTLAGIDLATRLLGLAALLALVDGPEDVMLVLWIYVVTVGVATVWLQALVYRHVPFRAPSWAGSRAALRASSALFVSNAAGTAYTSANVFLLGLLVPSSQVAFYAAAEKTVRAATRVLGSGAMAVNPRVIFLLGSGRPERANRLAVLSLACFTGVAAVAGLVVEVIAPEIVQVLFGSGFGQAASLLRILAVCIPLEVCGSLLVLLWLVPHTLERRTLPFVFAAGLLNVMLVVGTTRLVGVSGAAWSLVAVETLTVVAWVLLIRRSGVFTGRARPADEQRAAPTAAGSGWAAP
jgi:PST family polysaccharide transporter